MANVQLTNLEKQSLRADTGVFKQYLIQKVINEMGNQLGQSSFTTQTARWLIFSKIYLATPSIVVGDPNLVEFAVARMIQGGLAQRDNSAGPDLADQVVAFLEANAPSNIPQAYLDERTKQWS